MRGNWMEKYEKEKDDQLEEKLNYILEKNINILIEYPKIESKVSILTKIIEIYEALAANAFEYDRDDYEFRKKQLEKIRQEKQMEEHMRSDESESWNDFMKEELEIDEGEER